MKLPNILWIMTDQQSANMLGCAGNPYVHTPHLDALAAQAVRFENAYCTNPVCLPSRFSLLTGLYPGDIGVWKNENKPVPESVQRCGLGHLLKQAGYTVVYGGKEHIPDVNTAALGYDYICEDERLVLAETCAEYIADYDWEKPLFMTASFVNPHDICLMAMQDFEPVDINKEPPVWQEAYLQAAKAQQLPEGMPEEEFFATICPPLPDNYEPAPDEPEGIAILQQERVFKKMARAQYTDEQWRIHRWAYSVLTQQVDGQIGQVLEALRKSGQWDNTLILFTSDHGDMDASHKMEHKENLYQEACHIPLILKAPGQTKGRVVPHLVSNGLDLYPTVLDYCGIAPVSYLRGRSLRQILEGHRDEAVHDTLIIECENGIGAVSDRFKYVRYDKGTRNEQFYDLLVNPGEMYNQIEDPQYTQAVCQLRGAADAHLRSRPTLL